MPQFRLTVREMREATYTVEAETAEAAFAAVEQGKGVMLKRDLETIEVVRPDLWGLVTQDDQDGWTTRSLAEILEERLCGRIPDEEERNEVLDELVHDVASSSGSNVNNEGTLGQIEFLVEQLGAAAAWKDIKQAFGDES
jgi:hypothetical protein